MQANNTYSAELHFGLQKISSNGNDNGWWAFIKNGK